MNFYSDGTMKADINKLLEECQIIQEFLEEKVSEEPNELSDRLSMLCVYMARSGNMLADAKYIQDLERNRVYTEYSKLILKMPATVATKFIESQTGEVNYLVNWLDRINRTCTHQADSLRTIFSFVKENLKMARGGYY